MRRFDFDRRRKARDEWMERLDAKTTDECWELTLKLERKEEHR
jgi:hypothetical protein